MECLLGVPGPLGGNAIKWSCSDGKNYGALFGGLGSSDTELTCRWFTYRDISSEVKPCRSFERKQDFTRLRGSICQGAGSMLACLHAQLLGGIVQVLIFGLINY